MPKERNGEPGDNLYNQDTAVRSYVIKKDLAVVKGRIYTHDANGRLITPISAASVADLTRGIFQAMASASAPSEEDTDLVQCLTSRSRILLKLAADLVEGQDVELASTDTTTTPDKVKAAAFPHTKGFLGRLLEIYTPGTDGARKQKSADDDLGIVELRR